MKPSARFSTPVFVNTCLSPDSLHKPGGHKVRIYIPSESGIHVVVGTTISTIFFSGTETNYQIQSIELGINRRNQEVFDEIPK